MKTFLVKTTKLICPILSSNVENKHDVLSMRQDEEGFVSCRLGRLAAATASLQEPLCQTGLDCFPQSSALVHVYLLDKRLQTSQLIMIGIQFHANIWSNLHFQLSGCIISQDKARAFFLRQGAVSEVNSRLLSIRNGLKIKQKTTDLFCLHCSYCATAWENPTRVPVIQRL